MRWDRLLADIEATEEARQRAEMLGEAAERTRLETARISLESRLGAAAGATVTLEVDGPQRCAGLIDAVGPGWLVLDGGQVSWLIATAHLSWVADLPRTAAPAVEGAAKRIYERLGLAHVLRGVAADRSAVQVGVGHPEPLTGTIDRVGADFIDLAVHGAGELRRSREVRGHRTIPIAAIRFLSRDARG